MKIKIDFFSENIIDAIGAGIYQVSIMSNGKEEVLYISVKELRSEAKPFKMEPPKKKEKPKNE